MSVFGKCTIYYPVLRYRDIYIIHIRISIELWVSEIYFSSISIPGAEEAFGLFQTLEKGHTSIKGC